jgi:hypothetical protein
MVSEGDQMITAYRIILLLTLTLAVGAFPAGALAQVDQQALARTILGDDGRAAQEALHEATRALAPEEMGPELRAALISVLERENSLYHTMGRAARMGDSDRARELEREGWGEAHLFLIEAVGALRDPAAIPALVGAMPTGWMTIHAVAAFGEEAAPELLRFAEKGEAYWFSQVTNVLRTLILMIEEPQGPPLSRATLERTTRLAREQLTTGPDYPGLVIVSSLDRASILQEAMSLALALGDPPLRELVTSLARDPEAVRRLGIEDSSSVERIQRHAAEALARPPRRR